MLWSNGYTSFIVFKCHAHIALRIKEVEKEDEEADDEEALEKIAKTIVREIKENPTKEKVYQRRMNFQAAKKDVSPTLAKLLGMLDKKNLSAESLSSLLIGNIVTSKVAKRFTQLSLTLAVMVGKKKTVKKLSKFGVVSTYDELNRFRVSAAAAAHKKIRNGPLRHHSQGLVQGLADNFDLNISSVNGQKQTHSMALMMVQSGGNISDDEEEDEIPRLKKEELKDVEFEEIPKVEYQGPKQPSMPTQCSKQKVQSLKVLAMAASTVNIGKEVDFEFFRALATQDSTREFSGFNTKRFREAGVMLQPKTSSMYTPLIDEIPSDPTTVLTTLTEAIRLTEETGQEYTILTLDQQLYKVLVFIK